MEAETLLPYLAGIFDGEGCIVARRGTHHQLKVELGCPEVINLFLAALGGTTQRPRCDPRPCLNGRARAVMYTWWCSRRSLVIDALEALLPYLVVKRDAAIAALDLARSLGPTARGSQPRPH